MQYEVLFAELGGEGSDCVSASSGLGLDELQESIVLQADYSSLLMKQHGQRGVNQRRRDRGRWTHSPTRTD